MLRQLLLLLLVGTTLSLTAQSNQLAQQYYMDGEYEKAAELYLALAEENYNTFYFDRYVSSLMSLRRYDEAERCSKSSSSARTPEELTLYVTYGQLLEQRGDTDGAEKQYREAIKELRADRFQITQLANAFVQLTKYDQAIAVYERGSKLIKDEKSFAFNLGDLYRRKGATAAMITSYLDALEEDPDRVRNVQTYFQRFLDADGLLEAQKQLYARIQEDRKDNPLYPRSLGWVLIHRTRTTRAPSGRPAPWTGAWGRTASASSTSASWPATPATTRRPSMPSTTSSKTRTPPLPTTSKPSGKVYSPAAGPSPMATPIPRRTCASWRLPTSTSCSSSVTTRLRPVSLIQLAELEALYLNDLDKATGILKEIVDLNGVNEGVRASAKLSLADYYLMQGEVWESTLLYSQVDKQFKEDLLGHEAPLPQCPPELLPR